MPCQLFFTSAAYSPFYYGYVSYDIKRGSTAYVDSLMLMRTHISKGNYGYIHAQRLLERDNK